MLFGEAGEGVAVRPADRHLDLEALASPEGDLEFLARRSIFVGGPWLTPRRRAARALDIVIRSMMSRTISPVVQLLRLCGGLTGWWDAKRAPGEADSLSASLQDRLIFSYTAPGELDLGQTFRTVLPSTSSIAVIGGHAASGMSGVALYL